MSINKLIVLLIALMTVPAFAWENLVYTKRDFPIVDTKGLLAIADLETHINKINILASQAYYIDKDGRVGGSFNPQKLLIAQQHQIKFIALVSDGVFEPGPVHQFLINRRAQANAIRTIIELCKLNNFAGIQIDFEGMSVSDRDNFSNFYKNMAAALHQNHYIAAVAIVPRTSDSPETDYLKARFKNWSGVYDYKKLGQYSDFVTLMAYDQHTDFTTPGPVAGITWDEAIIKYGLKYIPASKISFGIPWYSAIWYTGLTPTGTLRNIGKNINFADVEKALQKNHATLLWDRRDEIPYTFYPNNYVYQYIFAENAASFKIKKDLAQKYRLHGISMWVLGSEDPKVWQYVPTQ